MATRGRRAPSSRMTKDQLIKLARGHAADARGLRFESEVKEYFEKQGWKLAARKAFKGREFDLVGKRGGGAFEDTEHLLVECKRKQHVTAGDVTEFMYKVARYYDSLPEIWGYKEPVHAYVAHTGSVNTDAMAVANRHKPPIRFKKF